MIASKYLYGALAFFVTYVIFSEAAPSSFEGYSFGDLTGIKIVPAVRGIRNNNPTNLVKGPSWLGLSTDQSGDAKFAVFDDMTYGIRAASKNLISYYNRGLQTVDAIIGRWSTTDQATYKKSVCDYMGVGQYQTLNILDPDIRGELIRAMIRVECGLAGSAFVTDQQIQDGVRMQ